MSKDESKSHRAVVRHLPCTSCGYNLNMLEPAGRCPECGTPIAESLRSDALEFTDSKWIDSLARGMRAIAWAPLWWLAVGVVLSDLAHPLVSQETFWIAAYVGQSIPCFFICLGLFRLSRAEPPSRRPRNITPAGVFWRRSLMLLAIACNLFAYAALFVSELTREIEPKVAAVSFFVMLPVLAAPTLLHLARRLRDSILQWWLRIACFAPLILGGAAIAAKVVSAKSGRSPGVALTALWGSAAVIAALVLIFAWNRLMVKLRSEQALAAANETLGESERQLASGMIRRLPENKTA